MVVHRCTFKEVRTLSVMNFSSFNTAVYSLLDGSERREAVSSVNPSRDVVRAFGFNEIPYSMHYEMNVYTSIGMPRNLTKVKSGVYFINGVVHSRKKIRQLADKELSYSLIEQMDIDRVDYVVETQGVWSTFDNTKDLSINA